MISLKVKVKGSGDYKSINELVVGDMVLCSDNEFHEVKSVITYSCSAYTITLSNFKRYTIPTILQLKTTAGFKIPDKGDKILFGKKLQPFVHEIQKELLNMLFYDILIDVPMISKEGLIFTRGEIDVVENKKDT